ncbi:hypothetical protein AGMMS4952_26440 [Spirochaetia bacterium]|nr:hypothetical protein AGMMS4952_26440 [Spirochaetia bacterium]
MIKNFAWILAFTVFNTVILEVSDVFFFLRVYRNYRITFVNKLFCAFVYKFKLRISIRMRLPELQHFLISLFAVSHIFKNSSNRFETYIYFIPESV